MTACESIRVHLSDHYEAHARLWCPPSPRGAVLYLHGIQSHGQWFERSASALAEAGFAILLPDRRGSGRNAQDRGHTPSVRRLLRDIADCLDELHVRTNLDRFHLLGVSWGGKLALAAYRYLPHRVRSLTLVAPGLFPRVDLPAWQKIRVAWSLLAARRALFDIPLNDPQLFTADPDRQRFIRDDPLALRRVTAGFLGASRQLDRYARGAAQIRGGCPCRVFIGERDRIIDNHATRAFVRSLPWPTRDIMEYQGTEHTLEFEPAAGTFITDCVTWLQHCR